MCSQAFGFYLFHQIDKEYLKVKSVILMNIASCFNKQPKNLTFKCFLQSHAPKL